MESTKFFVNLRVSFRNDKGTIRQIDKFKDKLQLGVEWDDKEKGKSYGFHPFDNIKLFNCVRNKSSFILESKTVFPIQISEAIRTRYIEKKSVIDEDISFSGLDKISNKDDNFANKLYLTNMNISFLDFDNEFFTNYNIENVKEIYLDHNLLQDWSQLKEILNKFKQINILNLGQNILENNFDIDINTSINTLVLNNTQISLSYVSTLLEKLTNLKELRLSKNNQESFITTKNDSLKILDLSLNKLNISIFNSLSNLENLEELILDENNLQISNEEVTEKLENQNIKLSNLKIISISDCKIKSEHNLYFIKSQTENIQSLNTYNNEFEELNLKNNSNVSELNKYEIIKMLACTQFKNLNKYNNSAVTNFIKNDQEKFQLAYQIRNTTKELFKNIQMSDQLIDKYGDPFVEKSNAYTINDYIKLKIKITDGNIENVIACKEKKIKLSMSVQELVTFVSKIQSKELKSRDFQLFYQKNSEVKLMDDQRYEIQYYFEENNYEVQIV